MNDIYILREVSFERGRQLKKWGQQDHDPATWLAILTEEVGEVAEEILNMKFGADDPKYPQGSHENYRAELIQVAAVAVAALDSFDRQFSASDRGVSV